ncbi:MAG: hypothetical protein ACREOU_14275 [Candidatus Eiseniibacteriota bacterium]
MKSAPLVGLFVLMLGVWGPATPGSAEALEPSVVSIARPASFAGSFGVPGVGSPVPLYVTRYYKPPPPPPPPLERPILGWATLRGGVFDADNVASNDWSIGFKTTGLISPMFQAGLSVDLIRRDEEAGSVIIQRVDGAGHVVESQATLYDVESNLVPVLGLLEVHFPTDVVRPYFGAAGGWEFLNVHEFDAARGYGIESNYDGPAYQFYGGANFAISPRIHLNAEAFWNGATVDREVFDPVSGFIFEERIDLDGWGARGGLSFAF